jgi:hypothetical protein
MEELEQKVTSVTLWVKAGVSLLAVLLVVVIVLMIRGR